MAHVGGYSSRMQTGTGRKEKNTEGTRNRIHTCSVYKSMWETRKRLNFENRRRPQAWRWENLQPTVDLVTVRI